MQKTKTDNLILTDNYDTREIDEQFLKINILCKNLINTVSFYMLTKPKCWKNNRYNDYIIGDATNLDKFISQNANYLFQQLDTNKHNFDIKEIDDEDTYYEAELKLFSIFRKMFPTIDCLHCDDQDKFKNIFLPDLRKIYEEYKIYEDLE